MRKKKVGAFLGSYDEKKEVGQKAFYEARMQL